MRVHLDSESDLTLSALPEAGFDVDVEPGVHAHYSALQMFATSFALCTASVLTEYADIVGAQSDDLSIRVRWSYADDPFRIDRIEMEVLWPSVPESRLKAAQRVATQCTLHHTFAQPPEVLTEVHR